MQVQRLEKLLQMLDENPADSFVLYALAMEYNGLNQIEEAEKYFRNCLVSDPNYIPALYQLALILNQTGRETEAISHLQGGLQLLQGGKDLKTLNEFRSLLDEIIY